MCLMVFAFKDHPEYNLIFASNRDEFYERPSLTARLWSNDMQIIGGKDLKKGGTWLGVQKTGGFSAVTNYRDPGSYKTNAESRGTLPINCLHHPKGPENYFEDLKKMDGMYNGFNLIAGDQNQLYHFSNIEKKINSITPGIHGISNALLNTPWPKVERAKKLFKKKLNQNKVTDNDLFEILEDRKKFSGKDLPQTGLTPEKEREVSSIFIQTDTYGTRCSSLLYIQKNGDIRFVERTYKPGSLKVVNEVEHKIIFGKK